VQIHKIEHKKHKFNNILNVITTNTTIICFASPTSHSFDHRVKMHQSSLVILLVLILDVDAFFIFLLGQQNLRTGCNIFELCSTMDERILCLVKRNRNMAYILFWNHFSRTNLDHLDMSLTSRCSSKNIRKLFHLELVVVRPFLFRDIWIDLLYWHSVKRRKCISISSKKGASVSRICHHQRLFDKPCLWFWSRGD
jgi:hypothetical protein